MIIFSAFTLSLFCQSVKKKTYTRLIGCGLVLLPLFWFINKGKAEKIVSYILTSLANLATYYQVHKDYEKGIATLHDALEHYPNDVNVHFVLGNIHTDMGQTEKAEREYGEVLRLNPNHIEVLYSLGVLHYNQREFQKARDLWSHLLSIDPSYTKAQEGLVLIAGYLKGGSR